MEKTILIIVINILLQFIVSAQPGISISVVTDKDTFLTLETIYIGASFTNNGKQTIKIPEPVIFSNSYISVYNEAGKKVNLLQLDIHNMYDGRPNFELRPNEEYYLVHNISDYIYDSLFWSCGRLKPGRYTIELSYYPDNKKISCNKIVVIKSPSSDDKYIYETFINTYSKRNKMQISHQEALGRLELLLKSYPKSVYAPLLCVWCNIINGYVNKNEMFIDLLFDFYSWSIFCSAYLPYRIEKIIKDSEKIDLLNKLKNKSEGKLMSRYYQKLINEVRSK